ncbi:MAG: VCBS repeat-containing protein [Pyrinomonadaceae bacterium]|nr:VCBS repeat-containing protein [Pyrinomonadaceae bacterium]
MKKTILATFFVLAVSITNIFAQDLNCVPNQPVYFADVTGDKRADAIVVNNDRITVRRSDGRSFGNNELWTNEAYYGQRGTFFADVTGDGKADAIVVNNGSVVVRRSDGSRFAENEFWTKNPYYGERGTYFGTKRWEEWV